MKKKALLVVTNDTERRIYENFFKLYSCRVDCMESPVKAAEMILTGKYDVILLDHKAPAAKQLLKCACDTKADVLGLCSGAGRSIFDGSGVRKIKTRPFDLHTLMETARGLFNLPTRLQLDSGI